MNKRNNSVRQCHGVLLLHKPSGPSSNSCLQKIKKICKQKKIGHAGTLDPLARGLLLVLLGQGTKLAPYLLSGKKQYQGTLQLGLETDTYDREGRITSRQEIEHLSADRVEKEIYSWLEVTEQTVPPYAAAKHKGRPLYALSRDGKEIPQKVKAVSIDQVEVLQIQLPMVKFRIICSKGTYVRSLVHSLGKRLKCGAVMTDLLREKSHPFSLESAYSMESILDNPQDLPHRVTALPDCLPHWPKACISTDLAEKVKNGVWLNCNEVRDLEADFPEKKAMFLDNSGQPLALVESRAQGGQWYWAIIRGLYQQ